MERPEFVAILSPLVVMMRAQFDQPMWTAYYRALEDVPAQLLLAAVERAQRTPREPYQPAFPTPPMLRQWAEQARKALIASLPYDPSACAQCDGTGWETRTEGGVPRVTRCGCWRRFQSRIQELGCGHVLMALSPGTEMES